MIVHQNRVFDVDISVNVDVSLEIFRSEIGKRKTKKITELILFTFFPTSAIIVLYDTTCFLKGFYPIKEVKYPRKHKQRRDIL